jgi:catechol 2,3-dioxygenase-like lactoylglutathione lyase family enzyme
MEPQQIDHVAISVGDFDDRLALLTGSLGMTLKRIGTYGKGASRRVAMVGDAAGFKLEIIEGDGPDTFEHVAWRVDDVQASFEAMVGDGFPWVSVTVIGPSSVAKAGAIAKSRRSTTVSVGFRATE